MMQDLESGLFVLASLLRLPVVVLLWGCIIVTLYVLGRFAAEYIGRHRLISRGYSADAFVKSNNFHLLNTEHLKQLPYFQALLLKHLNKVISNNDGSIEVEIEKSLDEVISDIQHGSDFTRVLTRVAPSLGLLGTLIPMGTALASLSSGSLDVMSGQMVVAFSTTVVGLACGTVGFLVHVVENRWINMDIRDCQYLTEWVCNSHEKNELLHNGEQSINA